MLMKVISISLVCLTASACVSVSQAVVTSGSFSDIRYTDSSRRSLVFVPDGDGYRMYNSISDSYIELSSCPHDDKCLRSAYFVTIFGPDTVVRSDNPFVFHVERDGGGITVDARSDQCVSVCYRFRADEGGILWLEFLDSKMYGWMTSGGRFNREARAILASTS